MRRELIAAKGAGALLAGIVALAIASAPSALASAPRWQLDATAAPTSLPPGGEGQLALTATNMGDAPVDASTEPLTLRYRLPPGVAASAILAFPLTYVGYLSNFGELSCTIPSSSLVTCTSVGGVTLPPFESLEVRVAVKVKADAQAGEEAEATISGGETPNAFVRQPLAFGNSTPFGIRDFKLVTENEDGSLQTQAGAHPFQFTSTLDFNETLEANKQFEGVGKLPTTPELLRNLQVNLPPGLIGNPTPFDQCTDLEFGTFGSANINLCPADSAVGVASVTLKEPRNQGFATLPVPIFNLTPTFGEPARFGFEALGVPVILDTAVRSGRDYGVVVNLRNISQAGAVVSSRVTFWGVPGDPRHDASRGWSCLDWFAGGSCSAPEGQQPAPFLTLPTSCGSLLTSTARADTWSGNSPPAVAYTFQRGPGEPIGLDGCRQLPFEPSFAVEPETRSASTPTGLEVGVHVPQDTTLSANGLAEADLKNTTFTLPAGVQVSPAAADGLLACSIPEVGFEGLDEQTSFFSAGKTKCPDAAKVGTVEIKTPLLGDPLKGAVYLAAQNANPFGSLLAMYIVAEDPASGVRVKLAGQLVPDAVTGQLISSFQNTPQLPFEDLTLRFFGGPRAPLTTPQLCGAYTATASFAPWSGNAPASASSSFQIVPGANGPPCANPLPFAPSVAAGSANLQAGAFTPFALTMSREDGNQNLARVTVHMPPGLLGMVSSLTPCAEAQAALGTCGPDSLIGYTVVSVGLGSDPFTVTGGQVFITEAYKGAPYGLSIAEPAKAGPFDLGSGPCDCVVVRAKIEVDPNTAALTIVSDPLPTILQGVPLQIKRANVTIDRSGFTFNPTNCAPLAIGAELSGEQQATASVSIPFQVANCATLPFKPKFAASTQAKTTKPRGASLRVTVGSGPGQANIAKVKVDLPRQLPSRLTTLQKACVDSVFEAGPEGCPAASRVGTATARTPILNSPLQGKAYLVSHGNAAFPDLEIVLRGEHDLTLVLDGKTDIKKGITSSTFNTVPDAPISSFELTLPQGPFSVLAANLPAKVKGRMCGQSLAMPTAITGQNGAVLKQTTKIAVSGCAKKKARKKAKKIRRKGKRSSAKKTRARHG